MEHKIEFKKFMDEYINKYSPFKIGNSVAVKIFGPSKRPYKINKIIVDDQGEISYEVISPRSYSVIPNLFKMSDLEIYSE